MRREKRLADLVEDLEGEPIGTWEGATVTGVAIDSRLVRPGDIFVAIKGERTDGAYFVPDAVKNGASAVVLPFYAGNGGGVPGVRVSDTRRALPVIAARFYDYPVRSLTLSGVTGTNGKTTSVYMIGAMLREGDKEPGLITTAEVITGRSRFRPEYTTPEAHDLHRYFRDMVDSGITHACMEVSSHGVVLGRVIGIPYSVGIVTNITPDHLDFHKTFEAYLEAKRDFVRMLGREAVCLLNYEDRNVREMASEAESWVFTFGFAEKADILAREVKYGSEGTSFSFELNRELPMCGGRGSIRPMSMDLTMPLHGRHNVLNALGAAAAALVLGVEQGAIVDALSGFSPPVRRLQVQEVNGYKVINDVAMNEGSYEAVLETMASMECPQLVVVNAIRGNRGPEVNARIAKVLSKWNKRLDFAPLIVTASRSHVALYNADYHVRPQEMDAFLETSREEGMGFSVHEELPPAIEEGLSRLKPGGVLLLLGTFGMDDGARIAVERLGGR